MTYDKWQYNPDGLNKPELTKFKKAFMASLSRSEEWKSIKNSLRHNKTQHGKKEQSCAYYFFDAPFDLGKRLPHIETNHGLCKWYSRARVISQNKSIMLVLSTCVNPNSVGDGQEPAIARTYQIKMTGKARIIPYRCQHDTEIEYINIYVYSRTIENAIEKFWASWNRQAMRYTPTLCTFQP